MAARAKRLRVYLERGDKRTFACALDWPGWARSGRDGYEAIRALLDYAPRYEKVVRRAKLTLDPRPKDRPFEIVQELKGGAGTDFGVPGEAPTKDGRPLTGRDLERWRALLQASWKAFDAAARSAEGKQLRLGPRGGGRDVAKMTGHVLEAEVAYLGALGSRFPKPERGQDEMAHVRKLALETLQAVVDKTPIENPRNTKNPWKPRYFVRRSAWHALDHAWEIEDRIER
ncbi:MAG TPA: DinB family protein [Candidatus Limnocylindria bacterium]|nr:DinB family protein [Candidatus Limnocylindria bacterium]